MLDQAESFGAHRELATVTAIVPVGDGFEVHVGDDRTVPATDGVAARPASRTTDPTCPATRTTQRWPAA